MSEVAVIIAAYNSAETIGRAVRSALAQPETAEVFVVDDASSDGTADAARAADDGSGRLKIMRQDVNCGPAAARNRAVLAAKAPLFAVLDADDYFLPGRLKALLEVPGWDLMADNIAFVRDPDVATCDVSRLPSAKPLQEVSLTDFILGNLPRPGRSRGELGFIKPVVRREWFAQRGFRYDERLRLGEDYALYSQLLLAGGRLVLTRSCGYVALVRPNSLAADHRIGDLENLLDFDRRLQKSPALSDEEGTALRKHERHLELKVHVRRVLEKRHTSISSAAVAAVSRPKLLPDLCLAIANDRISRRRLKNSSRVRYLLD